MYEGYVVFVPKDVCVEGVCVCMCTRIESEFMLSVPCKGMCTWMHVAIDTCVARRSGGRLILEKLFQNSDK